MQIILVHSRLASARSITIKRRHVAAAIGGLGLLVITGAAFLYYLTFRHAAEIRLPILKDLLLVATAEDAMKKDKWVRENISAMAVKLGEMQAQLVRLDALGERVSSLAGIKPSEFNFKELPGRGGPLNSARDISIPEFKSTLDKLVKSVDQRNDYLNVVETTLMNNRVANKLLPTILPVNGTYNASGFGWRSDPFTGAQAFHQGIDFIAQSGTPIVAAAGGVVVASEYHPQYGNMVDVDHGNDLTTRYAHSSRILVKVGDIVKRGQHIADVGSTGRSTGSHLHFEVHLRGSSMDPNKFLLSGQDANLVAK